MLSAVVLFGIKFSGTQALIVGAVVLVILVAAWWVWQRRRA
ncbi:MAG TPA: hypothetical protein VEY67_10345 [Candidatus Dormibacteraeota bacterium]|nr:hypothetical protein [Candidatus Dormibacteraeota bacterium]